MSDIIIQSIVKLSAQVIEFLGATGQEVTPEEFTRRIYEQMAMRDAEISADHNEEKKLMDA